MHSIPALWLPIVLSAVFVFVASSLIHMIFPWHKNDYSALPDETRISDSLRPFAIPPGDYMMPRPARREDMKSPEFMARIKAGPNMVITVLPNEEWAMGRTLALWLLYCLVVSIFAGHIAWVALRGAFDAHAAFHFTAITAFVGYSLALWQLTLWYGRSLATTFKSTVDGIIYAAITGATFMWLWPR